MNRELPNVHANRGCLWQSIGIGCNLGPSQSRGNLQNLRVRKDSPCLATTESRRRLSPKTFATQQLAKPIARPEGFEPSTPGLEGALSEQMVNIGLEGALSEQW